MHEMHMYRMCKRKKQKYLQTKEYKYRREISCVWCKGKIGVLSKKLLADISWAGSTIPRQFVGVV